MITVSRIGSTEIERENKRRLFVEKRITSILFSHLKGQGWKPCAVFDGEITEAAHSAAAATRISESVDESRVIFRNEAGSKHTVLLIRGNGIDLISDWGSSEGDADGFNAAIELICDHVSEVYG